MTTWLDSESITMKDRSMTICERIQSIIDNDTEALQSLRRSKRKGLFKRVIKARKIYGIEEISIVELKEKIQKYVEEDHCYQ
jgi:hypothetical protein